MALKIAYVNSYRYLGVELDQYLTMEAHLNHIIRRVKPKVYQLGKLRYFISNETAVLIYKTFILPVIEIGNYALDGVKTGQTKTLRKIQNRILRICFKAKLTDPSFPLHIHANSCPLI